MNTKTLFFAILFAVCYICNIAADVTLPSILSDNMVLQQQTTVNIWGKAAAGEQVTVTPSWNKKSVTTTADANGRWTLKIATPKVAQNQQITIQGKNVIVIKNILVGEVWLCSGQSNMDFPVAKGAGWKTSVIDYDEQMKDADYPEIRLFHVKQITSLTELDDCEGEWVACNVENLKDFSAVGFFFGRELYKNLKQPVGLIHSAWGGTPAEAWTKMSVIAGDAVYAPLLKTYRETEKTYPADLKKYEEERAAFEKARAAGDASAKSPRKPTGVNHSKSLATLWNGMINPLVPYAIKGVIWYQGESNEERYADYKQVFTNLITSWRKEWNEGDFPFYFVQIAPFYQQRPQIREAQLETWLAVKNTGMAVITDAGDSTDIHPRNKFIPAERLARWALAKDYGKKIAFSGPLYKSLEITDNKAIITFDYTNGGLKAKGEKLIGFTVAGADKVFYPATAVIENNKVIITSENVKKPVAVRYGWDNFFRVNLYNGAGLPASPFRTDK
jgi:hypothetical protein